MKTIHAAPLLALVLAAPAARAAGPYETPSKLHAKDVLPAEMTANRTGKVADEVGVQGYFYTFRMDSPYGAFDVTGTPALRIRLREADALAELDKVSKSEVFAKAAGQSVLKVGKSAAAVVSDPGATAKGVGGGLKRVGVNLGRKAKGAGEAVKGDDQPAEGQDKSTADAAAGAAKSVTGVSAGARRWAQKVSVDPYTDNEVLQKALEDLGKIDAAGAIAAKVVVPIPTVVGLTATTGNLVWGKDPQELRKINEQRLAELGVDQKVAAAFFKNASFSPSLQTRFIAALWTVKAKGAADYVDSAARADSRVQALFFVTSAEMAQEFAAATPVAECLTDSNALVVKTADGRAVALLPLDQLLWTEALEKAATEIAGRAKTELGATTLEARLTGRISPAAGKGMAALGWKVTPGVPVSQP